MKKSSASPTRRQQRYSVAQRARIEALEAKLAEWWEKEETDWDKLIGKGAKGGNTPNSLSQEDAYGGMPQVDSKAIARSSPVFEEALGIKLEVGLIQSGGYQTIEEAIKHLVPEMVKKAVECGTF